MAKLTIPPFKEYDNLWKTVGSEVDDTVWTAALTGGNPAMSSISHDIGSIKLISNVTGTSRNSTATLTGKINLISLGNNFMFSVHSRSNCNNYSNSAGSTVKINNTTLLSTSAGQNTSTGGGVTFWVKISGNNMNIKRVYSCSSTGTFSPISNDTNVDITGVTSFILTISSSGNTTSNSYATAYSEIILSPIIFTKELIGSNKTL